MRLSPAIQLKLSYLLGAIVFALALVISQPVAAQDAPTVTKWEYAQVLLATQEKVVFAFMTDEDEQAEIQAELDELKPSDVGSLPMLNIMGEYGWEFVIYDTSQQSNGFLAYFFKRPKA